MTLRKECPYLAFFWSTFSHIRTEYRELYIQCECGLLQTTKIPNTDTVSLEEAFGNPFMHNLENITEYYV